jgi:hypothetical protein
MESFDLYFVLQWVISLVLAAGFFFLLLKASAWAVDKLGTKKGWDIPATLKRTRIIAVVAGLWVVFQFLPIDEASRDQYRSLILLASVALLVMISIEPLRRLFLPAQYHNSGGRSARPVPDFKGKLFVSYRRADTQRVVDRLCDKLFEHLGRDSIFRDIDSVGLGQDFRLVVQNTLDDCSVGLVVVGPDWVGTLPDGGRRIDQDRDLVRLEVKEMLERDIPLIPVLVDDVHVPSEADLPEGLKDLTYRNSARLRPDPDFENDVERLVRGIRQSIE